MFSLEEKDKNQIILEEHCKSVILNEAYFGKHPLLREIETQMDIIRKNILKNPFYDATDSKENKKITKNLEKLFNAESVSLIWSSDCNDIDTFTYPVCQIMQFKNKLKTTRTSNGVKFKDSKGIHFYIVMTNSLVTVGELDNKQLTAILLHEVGHNFYNTGFFVFMNKYVNTIVSISKLTNLIEKFDILKIEEIFNNTNSLLMQSGSLRKFNNLITSKHGNLLQYPIIFKSMANLTLDIMKLGESISKYIEVLVNILNYPRNVLYNSLTSSIFLSLSGLFKRYESELFADTFSSMYGYSEEIAQVRLKFDNIKHTTLLNNILSKIPVLNYINTFYNEIEDAGRKLMSNNDNGRTSSLSQIEYLKKELKNSKLDKKLQEELKEQIKKLEEIHEYSISAKHNIETANFFRLLFSKLLGKKMDKINLSKNINTLTYTVRGKKFDASFEDILDGKQNY